MTKSKKLRILFYKIITRGSAHPLIAWTETLLISAFAAFLWTNAISIEVTDASDTVSMSVEYTHEFFWPLLFVLLIALRYGFTLGLVSSISTIVLALVFYKYHGIMLEHHLNTTFYHCEPGKWAIRVGFGSLNDD